MTGEPKTSEGPQGPDREIDEMIRLLVDSFDMRMGGSLSCRPILLSPKLMSDRDSRLSYLIAKPLEPPK